MQSELLFNPGLSESAIKSLEGFRYEPSFIDHTYESELLAQIQRLPFREFEFHGYLGKRRIVSYGWRYEYSGRGVLKGAEDIPEFLVDLRARAASFAQLKPAELQQVLVTEYRAGAGIGWHCDKPVFDRVVGVSLLAPCILRFRRKVNGKPTAPTAKKIWERVNIVTQPRSAYLLTGLVRSEWEHSILRVDEDRYSVTYRSLH